jgi:hypothetical protein
MSEAEISAVGHGAPTFPRRFMGTSHNMYLKGGS